MNTSRDAILYVSENASDYVYLCDFNLDHVVQGVYEDGIHTELLPFDFVIKANATSERSPNYDRIQDNVGKVLYFRAGTQSIAAVVEWAGSYTFDRKAKKLFFSLSTLMHMLI